MPEAAGGIARRCCWHAVAPETDRNGHATKHKPKDYSVAAEVAPKDQRIESETRIRLYGTAAAADEKAPD